MEITTDQKIDPLSIGLLVERYSANNKRLFDTSGTVAQVADYLITLIKFFQPAYGDIDDNPRTYNPEVALAAWRYIHSQDSLIAEALTLRIQQLAIREQFRDSGLNLAPL